MGISANADVRQMHELRIPAMPVDGLDPEPRHGEPHAPIILPSTLRRFFRNIVTVVDNDRNAGKLPEILQRHRFR